jgi:hypothetical protein
MSHLWLVAPNRQYIQCDLEEAYLDNLVNKGSSDSHMHGHARAIKTFASILHAEKFIDVDTAEEDRSRGQFSKLCPHSRQPKTFLG